MHPKEQLDSDLKMAMRSKDAALVTLLRTTLAAFKDAEQRKREDLVKKAADKHNVMKPVQVGQSEDDKAAYAAALQDYSKALDAALTAEKIGRETPLDQAEAYALIQKLIKQRQDSIADAQKAGRKDVQDRETHEMEILQSYLPKQMSREEIEAEARAIIAQVGASSARDMGKVMGPLMGKLQGRADGKLISEVVRSLLG